MFLLNSLFLSVLLQFPSVVSLHTLLEVGEQLAIRKVDGALLSNIVDARLELVGHQVDVERDLERLDKVSVLDKPVAVVGRHQRIGRERSRAGQQNAARLLGLGRQQARLARCNADKCLKDKLGVVQSRLGEGIERE